MIELILAIGGTILIAIAAGTSLLRSYQIRARVRRIAPSPMPKKVSKQAKPQWQVRLEKLLLGKATWPQRQTWQRFAMVATISGVAASAAFNSVLPGSLPGTLSAFLISSILSLRITAQLNQKAQAKAFLKGFPDSLDILIRQMRIGVPLEIAISDVSRRAPAPVGPIYAEISRWIHVGLPLSDAVTKVSERISLKPFSFFSIAVVLQAKSGGNFVDIAEGLAKSIRQHQTALLRGRAASSQARITAYVLIAVPIILIFSFIQTKPGYFAPLVSGSNAGWMILGYSAISFLVGVAIINRYLSRFPQV